MPTPPSKKNEPLIKHGQMKEHLVDEEKVSDLFSPVKKKKPSDTVEKRGHVKRRLRKIVKSSATNVLSDKYVSNGNHNSDNAFVFLWSFVAFVLALTILVAFYFIVARSGDIKRSREVENTGEVSLKDLYPEDKVQDQLSGSPYSATFFEILESSPSIDKDDKESIFEASSSNEKDAE